MLDGFLDPNQCASDDSVSPGDLLPDEEQSFEVLGARFDSIMHQLQASGGADPQSLPSRYASVAAHLCERLLRTLHITEAALTLLSNVVPTGSLGDVVTELLQPACRRAEAAEMILGTEGWPAVRALSVRCMALHASILGSEALVSHGEFFVTVLKELGPMLPVVKGTFSSSTEPIVETCVVFLTDMLTQGISSIELVTGFFEALAAVLGPPGSTLSTGARRRKGDCAGLSLRLRRQFTEQLCRIFLYGSGLHIRSDEPVPPCVCWALTWLLLEAFYQSPPAAVTTSEGDFLEEVAEEADHRGRLIRFFGCLGRASPTHARLLATAVEGFLSTDLWRLGVAVPLGMGRHWSSIQIPRLLRLFGRELAAGDTCGGQELWLGSMWRPLAVLCLEGSLDCSQHHASRPTNRGASRAHDALAEALFAAVAVMDKVGRARGWAVSAEVKHVLERLMCHWGDSGESQVPAASYCVRLSSWLAHFSQDSCDDPCSDWSEVYAEAERRGAQLRMSFSSLGVNMRSIVVNATEAMRVRPSRLFFAQRVRPERKVPRPQKRPRVDDDDSGTEGEA